MFRASLWFIVRQKTPYRPPHGLCQVSTGADSQNKEVKKIAQVTISVILVLGIIMLWLSSTNRILQWLDAWLGNYYLAVIGAMLAALVSLAAYMVGAKRYYIYAVLGFIAFSVDQLLNTRPGLPVAIAGGVIILSGLVILIRFMRKYPKPAEDRLDDNQ